MKLSDLDGAEKESNTFFACGSRELASDIGNGKFIAVLFWGSWNRRSVELLSMSISSSRAATNASLLAVNVDEDPEAALEWTISHIPTLAIFRDQVEVTRLVGEKTLYSYRSFIQEHADVARLSQGEYNSGVSG